MKVKVLGIQRIEYQKRDTGEWVRGFKLHSAYPDPNVTGQAVDGIFVNDRLDCKDIALVKPGDMVDMETNFRGNVVGVTLCK